MKRLVPALLALSLAAGAAASPGRREELFGTRIAALSFEGDAAPDAEAFARLTDLRPGQVLTEGAVRRAIRNLFATRRFLDLSVEASPGPQGLQVVVRYAAAPRIRTLEISGKGIPDKGRLRDTIGLSAGDLWAADASEPIEEAIRAHLRARGRFEAKVAVVVTGDPEADVVDVRFDIEPGPAATAGPPEWIGSLASVSPAGLMKEARQKAGKAYSESRARGDAERFEAWLRRNGHGRAEVRWEGAAYDPGTKRATPRYKAFVGPRTLLRVAGVPESEVRKHAGSPWSRLEPPDEETVRMFRGRLLESYQEEGYARAKVDVTFEMTDEEEIASFTVEKGDRFAVGRVAVEGTKAVRAGTVRDAVVTTPPGLFTKGRLVESELRADAEAILGVYRSRGYRDAKVAPPEVAPGARPFTLDATLRVTEGPLYTVASRSISGNGKLSEEELRPGLLTEPGRPFTEEGVNADVAALGGRYQEKGFADARVEGAVKLRPADDPSRAEAEVAFSIFEGDQVLFDRAIVRGYRKTRLSVIERELGRLEGQPFSLTKTLEIQRNLTALGVFSRVEVAPFPTDPDTGRRTVVVTVTEGKPWSLLYGLGAEYDSAAAPQFSPRVSFGASYNNLFGRAIVAGGEIRYSKRETRFRLFALEPSFFDLGVPLSFQVFDGQDTREGYDVKRRGFYIDTQKKLSARVKMAVRYQYELVNPSQDPGLGADQRQDQENRISSIGPAVSWDTRDDPIDPKKGLFVSLETKYAFPLFAATADFVRGSVLAAGYLATGAASRLAVAGRVGAIEPLGPCNALDNPTCQPNLQIPIPERIFAGGRTTHRAFGQDALGIPGQTVNADGVGYGGNGLLLFNVEWRVRAAGDLGIALFFDVGNVWDDWRKIRFREMRPGAGAGLFYMTPVGPVRIDYGVKLDRKPEESLGTFHFSVGYAF